MCEGRVNPDDGLSHESSALLDDECSHFVGTRALGTCHCAFLQNDRLLEFLAEPAETRVAELDSVFQ